MPDAGAVFGIAYLVAFVPLSLVAVVLFVARSDMQPIKARLPPLVVLSDVVLIVFVIMLCVQRIVQDDYPCIINVWQQFIGMLVLLNVYVVRCWILYFNYNHTQLLLRSDTVGLLGGAEREKQLVSPDMSPTLSSEDRARVSFTEPNFFFRYKKFTELTWLAKAILLLTVVLLIPAAVLTATEKVVRDAKGDDACDRKWGDVVIALYVALYALIYGWFAVNMRQVVDGFYIKEELRFTASVAVVAVIPWYLFNNSFEDTNNDVFPFSTLAVALAATAAIAASTFWPLYRSIYQPPKLDFNIPADLSSLKALLEDEQGFKSFKDFLTREFSVENILFWADVRDFRAEKARGLDDMMQLQMARNIYAKYIIPGAPYEVNLPAQIVQDLEKDLKEEYGKKKRTERAARRREEEKSGGGPQAGLSISITGKGLGGQVSTIFDNAVANIFHLMETDSYQRYIASDLYRALLTHYDHQRKTKKALQQMDML